MRRAQSQDNRDEQAREHGRILSKRPKQQTHRRPAERSAGVNVLCKDIGPLHAAEVAQNSAADSREHSADEREEYPVAAAECYADGRAVRREHAQTDGIRQQEQQIGITVLAVRMKARADQKHKH